MYLFVHGLTGIGDYIIFMVLDTFLVIVIACRKRKKLKQIMDSLYKGSTGRFPISVHFSAQVNVIRYKFVAQFEGDSLLLQLHAGGMKVV